MISFALQGLAEKLGGLIDRYRPSSDGMGNHTISVVYTQETNREPVKLDSGNRNISFLRLTSLAIDNTGRKWRRNWMHGALEGMTGYEKVQVVPMQVDVEWTIPLHSGVGEYFSMLKPIVDITQGRADFTLRFSIGSDQIPMEIRIELTSDIPLPVMEGEIQETQIPTVTVSLRLHNTWLLLNGAEPEVIPAITSIDVMGLLDGEGTLVTIGHVDEEQTDKSVD